MTFTDSEMREQVSAVLGADVEDFDVAGIVDRLQEKYGTVDIDTISSQDFWAIVERFDS